MSTVENRNVEKMAPEKQYIFNQWPIKLRIENQFLYSSYLNEKKQYEAPFCLLLKNERKKI